MITSLSIKLPEKPKGIKKLFYFLKNDKVEVEIKKARGVSVKHLTYTSYSGKIRIDKIDSIIGAQRNHLLCSPTLKFPENSGYRRFSSNAFSQRLCTNMALSAIESCVRPETLKIGLYDPDGDSHDILFHILKHCSDVKVVTNDFNSYQYELERAMDELGASAVVTQNISELCDRLFVIAPCVIEEKLPLKQETLVLTTGCPKVPSSGLVYYKYHLRMPNRFDLLKPKDFDEEYFCSALYTLASQYELGSIVPLLCCNYSSSQTVKSLCAYLNRFA